MLSIDDTQHEPAHVSLLPVLHQPQGRHEEASRKKSQLRELAPQKGICIGRKSNRAEEKKIQLGERRGDAAGMYRAEGEGRERKRVYRRLM